MNYLVLKIRNDADCQFAIAGEKLHRRENKNKIRGVTSLRNSFTRRLGDKNPPSLEFN